MSGSGPPDGRWRIPVLVAVAELLAMTLWFSAAAAAPELAEAWNLAPGETAWLTNAVRIGFVAGALLSSVLTLSDAVLPRHLFAGPAVVVAAATAAIVALVGSCSPSPPSSAPCSLPSSSGS